MIQVENLFKAFGPKLAVNDVSFSVERGEVLGFLGPNGAGKSTLMDALVRAYRARGETVGIVAVDPSSSRSGGALLGDRVRVRSAATTTWARRKQLIYAQLTAMLPMSMLLWDWRNYILKPAGTTKQADC